MSTTTWDYRPMTQTDRTRRLARAYETVARADGDEDLAACWRDIAVAIDLGEDLAAAWTRDRSA